MAEVGTTLGAIKVLMEIPPVAWSVQHCLKLLVSSGAHGGQG